MTRYQRKALFRFFCGSLCMAAGVTASAWGLVLVSLAFLYGGAFLVWTGWKANLRGIRIRREVEWWGRAKNGVEQYPLNPCCIEFGDTDLYHDDAHCTRRRYPMPRVISKEELEEIDRAWAEIISRIEDPE